MTQAGWEKSMKASYGKWHSIYLFQQSTEYNFKRKKKERKGIINEKWHEQRYIDEGIQGTGWWWVFSLNLKRLLSIHHVPGSGLWAAGVRGWVLRGARGGDEAGSISRPKQNLTGVEHHCFNSTAIEFWLKEPSPGFSTQTQDLHLNIFLSVSPHSAASHIPQSDPQEHEGFFNTSPDFPTAAWLQEGWPNGGLTPDSHCNISDSRWMLLRHLLYDTEFVSIILKVSAIFKW